MATTRDQYRIRLPRGRHVHAAEQVAGWDYPVTLCGTAANGDHDELDDDTTVTCPKCQSKIGDPQ